MHAHETLGTDALTGPLDLGPCLTDLSGFSWEKVLACDATQLCPGTLADGLTMTMSDLPRSFSARSFGCETGAVSH